jgi:ribonuclease Y
MAVEIGLDVRLARRAGLLHDIGKTVSREMEGSHVDLGVKLAERFGEHPVVREVIAEHHEDSERMSPICFLVKASDTISSTRPGGRREDLEGYARRIMRLEEIANSFEGVRDVYAINAGREIRVMVRGDRVSDDAAEILAFDIAEKVKNELTFAGQVKVMVVRETQAVRYTGRNRNRRNHQRPAFNRQRGRRSRNAVSQN